MNGTFVSTDLSTGYVPSANANGPGSRNIDLFIKVHTGVVVNGNVTQADLMASNGVIHVINKVILTTDVVDITSSNSNFSSLVGAL